MSFKSYNKPWFKPKKPKRDISLIKTASGLDNNPKYGYYGFKLYFPDENDINVEKTLKCTKIFQDYIKSNENQFDFDSISTTNIFNVDYNTIISENSILSKNWVDFRNEIIVNTKYCLTCMEMGMYQVIVEQKTGNEIGNLGMIHARLTNFQPVQDIKDIRVNLYGKLTSVRGTIIKVGNVKIYCDYRHFSCSVCTGEQVCKQIDNCYTLPNSCPTEGCRAKSGFEPLLSSNYNRVFNSQTIKIQELVANEDKESGRVPRTLECQLTHNLVDCYIPGDDITITGIVQSKSQQQNNLQSTTPGQTLFLLAVSAVNNKDSSENAPSRITFTPRDYSAIQRIHSQPNLFRLLCHSLSPNIFGHESVKAGLILSLFSTNKKSHILLVGDPGLGKSQMLLSCAATAPRSVYVCGNSASSCGLTATVVRESRGDYAIEAGALLLADQGVCCIDEFDKMKAQHASLLEAMAQQTVSVAKAGTVCTLPARTAVLAAANPSGGHYDKSKTVAENLKMSSPMLSRFDLIFILVDQPDEEIDEFLSEHVLSIHKNSISMQNLEFSTKTSSNLKDKLRLQPNEVIDRIPCVLLRKYIAYAQEYVHPKLSKEAEELLEQFYLQLRKQYRSGDSTPVTMRQLNSLVKLSEARARTELREQVTVEDVQDVIDIMKESLIDVFTDEVGDLDTTRSLMGSGMSSKKQCMQLLALLQQKSDRESKNIFDKSEILKLAQDAGVAKNKFYNMLDSLNVQGFLLYKGGNRYQLVSTV